MVTGVRLETPIAQSPTRTDWYKTPAQPYRDFAAAQDLWWGAQMERRAQNAPALIGSTS